MAAAAPSAALEEAGQRRLVGRTVWLVGSLTAVAALLRFGTLGLQSYWLDEAFTVEHVQASFGHMLSQVGTSEATPPLYDVLAWVWARAFGDGEVALRSLSALLGSATVPVVYGAGATLVSRRAGIFAAAFVAASPLLLWYSQEARAYALLTFLSALSLLLLGRALAGDRRALTWWAVVAALALATHYYGVFLLAGEALWLLADPRTRRRALVPIGAVAVVGAALVPLLLHQGVDQVGWIHGLSLHSRVREAFQQFATGGYNAGHAVALGVLVLAATLAAAIWVCDRRERRAVSSMLALAAVAAVGPLVVAVAATKLFSGHGDVFFYRYLLPAWPPLALALGGVVGARRAGQMGALAACCVLVVFVGADYEMFTKPKLQRDDWRGAARALGPVRVERAVVVEPSEDRIVIPLYRHDLHVAQPQLQARELDLIERPAPGFFPTKDVRPAGFALVSHRRVQHFTVLRFRSATPRSVAAALASVPLPPLGWAVFDEPAPR